MNKFKEIISIAPIVSILWLFSGYFYLIIYYGYFGIEVHKYFSIQDYIRASIDKIISITIIVIFMYIYMEYTTRRDGLTNKDYYKGWYFKGKYVKDKFLVITAILLILMLIIVRVIKPGIYFIQYFICHIAILLIWLELCNHLFTSNYFKDTIIRISSPYVYMTIISLVPISLMHLYFTAKVDASFIAGFGNNKKVIIRMSEGNDRVVNEYSNFLIIGTNSDYYFLYDKNSRKTIIVPIRFIKNIIYQH